MAVEGLDHAARLEQVVRRQHLAGLAPGDRLARQQQRLREGALHRFDIVQNGDDGAVLAMPALDQRQQIGAGARINRGEGLVEQDDVGVLQQEPGEQRALDRKSVV